MKYFKQKTPTDCLLASLECLTQRPRKEMSKELIRFIRFNKKRYLPYKSMAKILKTHFHNPEFLAFDDADVEKAPINHEPSIVGMRFKNNKQNVLHAVYWDGSRFFEPSTGKFLNKSLMVKYGKVSYIINKKSVYPSQYNCMPYIFESKRSKKLDNCLTTFMVVE